MFIICVICSTEVNEFLAYASIEQLVVDSTTYYFLMK